MKRKNIEPRRLWQKKVEAKGLIFHTTTTSDVTVVSPGGYREAPVIRETPREVKHVYWREGTFYELSLPQIEELERVTSLLQEMCMEAVQRVIDNELYEQFEIPSVAVPLILDSWNKDQETLYGRFDLWYDGVHAPRLYEYNADTPTSLLEAGVIQWDWLQDTHRAQDQFNSIHERLIAAWKRLRETFQSRTVHFAHLDNPEDAMTVGYLRDTAAQAGLTTRALWMEEIGWVSPRFVDGEGKSINTMFKLYPWEWMVREGFARHLLLAQNHTHWIEPAWKMILSNKAILPLLWEMFPDHPNLLPAFRDEHPSLNGEYVRKPYFSREGGNITLVDASGVTKTDGPDGEEPMIYQALQPLPDFDGYRPVVGSWVINGEAAGMGIRESIGPITDNRSCFVPHLIA